MNFNYWKNEIADMPTRDDKGNWYDLETGLYFDNSLNKKPSEKKVKVVRKTKLQKEIEEIKSKDWKTLSQEEKNHLYSLIKLSNAK